jgi:hypothetical protein
MIVRVNLKSSDHRRRESREFPGIFRRDQRVEIDLVRDVLYWS